VEATILTLFQIPAEASVLCDDEAQDILPEKFEFQIPAEASVLFDV